LHVVDEFTREALAIECRRRIDADQTVAVLDALVCARGRAPQHIRCDNGPELTANALRDWCRFSGAGSAYIDPGSPWQNPFVESFGSRIRDELLGVEQFSCLLEAQVLVADWREDYNERRPHSALAMQAPARFAWAWHQSREDGKAITPGGLPEGRRTAQIAPVTTAMAPNEPDPDAGTPTAALAALALRARSARRRHPYDPHHHRPPTLTQGGPMNGARSTVAADVAYRPVVADDSVGRGHTLPGGHLKARDGRLQQRLDARPVFGMSMADGHGHPRLARLRGQPADAIHPFRPRHLAGAQVPLPGAYLGEPLGFDERIRPVLCARRRELWLFFFGRRLVPHENDDIPLRLSLWRSTHPPIGLLRVRRQTPIRSGYAPRTALRKQLAQTP